MKFYDRNIALEQLKKVRHAKIPEPDANGVYHIKKTTDARIDEGHAYLIELNDRLLADGGFPDLQSNWNKGSIPPMRRCMADVSKTIGDYFHSTCLEVDSANHQTGRAWEGWLLSKEVTVLEELQ